MPAKSAGKKPRENEHDIGRARAAICPALPALRSSGAALSPASGYAGAGSPKTLLIAIAARSAFGQAATRCRAEPRRRGQADDALAVPVVPGRAQQELRLPGFGASLPVFKPALRRARSSHIGGYLQSFWRSPGGEGFCVMDM